METLNSLQHGCLVFTSEFFPMFLIDFHRVFCIFFAAACGTHLLAKMEDGSSDSDAGFDEYLEDLIRDRAGLGVSDQNDVSVSSVHTSDLSDFNPAISSSEDEVVSSDAEWSDTIEEHEWEPFTEELGPQFPLGLDAEPLQSFIVHTTFY